MPCLILTGHPSSGKTTLAHKLRERAQQVHKIPVVVIDEDSVCLDQTKQACYQDAQAEKKTRAALKAAFDRACQSNTQALVIVDSLNYIKGFRYELYCISKAARQKHGVVWVLNDVNMCKEWNQSRRETTDSYTDEQVQELILRFEPPDARNRWDQPLYRVDMSHSSTKTAQEALDRSVYNMHKLSDAIDQQTDANIDPNRQQQHKVVKKSAFRRAKTAATTNQETKSPNAEKEASNNTPQSADLKQSQLSINERVDQILNSFLLDIKPLQEGMSTRQQIATDTDALHNIETITQRICSSIMAAQDNATTATSPISLGNHDLVWHTQRRIPLAELKRLRRQYIQWIQTHPPQDSSEKAIAQSFVSYMEAQH